MKLILAVLATLVGTSLQSCSEEFKADFVKRHNELRAKHGVGPLTLDDSINNYAQEWADNLARSGRMYHRQPNKYGENIYMSWASNGATPSGSAVVQAWYNEIKDYHYYGREPSMSGFGRFGHFTQVVWKGSNRIGVGCASRGGKTFVVGNYSPAGNMMGRFAQNVLAPGSAPSAGGLEDSQEPEINPNNFRNKPRREPNFPSDQNNIENWQNFPSDRNGFYRPTGDQPRRREFRFPFFNIQTNVKRGYE